MLFMLAGVLICFSQSLQALSFSLFLIYMLFICLFLREKGYEMI